MSFLENVFGGNDAIRRNFAKLEQLFKRLAVLEGTVLGGSGGGSGTGTGPAQARVFNSANISIAVSGAPQALTFNSERWDTGNFHSTAANTSRLTAPTAGLYLIGGCVLWDGNATGFRALSIRLNGATGIGQTLVDVDSAINHVLNPSSVYQLAAGDYVELVANQSSGGALNVLASGNQSPEFWIVRLGSQA